MVHPDRLLTSSLGKVLWIDEIRVDGGHRAGDDSGVIAEKQPTQSRDKSYTPTDQRRVALPHYDPLNCRFAGTARTVGL